MKFRRRINAGLLPISTFFNVESTRIYVEIAVWISITYTQTWSQETGAINLVYTSNKDSDTEIGGGGDNLNGKVNRDYWMI